MQSLPVRFFGTGEGHENNFLTTTASAPLFREATHSFSGRLAITLDGKRVSNVSQVNIRIKNTGAIPIEKKDIDTPLSIDFKKPAQVLSVSVISAVPKDLAIEVPDALTAQQDVRLPPMLLNPRDEFSIAALVAEFDGSLVVSGRVVGVNSIKRLPDREASALRSSLIQNVVGIMVLAVLSLLISTFIMHMAARDGR